MNRPERNHEVVIVKFTDVAMGGVLHNGFDIMIHSVDMRDYLADKCKLEIVSKNEMLLTMPAMNLWNLEEFENFFTYQKNADRLCQRTKQGHDVFRNAMQANKERLKKYLLLRFPSNLSLSTRHYSDHKMELSCKIVPTLDFSFTWKGNNISQKANILYWKVSVEEESERVVEKVNASTETKGEKELAQLLASMSL